MDNHQKIAVLESHVDHLETELSYLNALLIKCGFTGGIATLKMTAEELLKENQALEERASPEA